jgi:hypothetical protein
VGCPIRRSGDQRALASPPGLSQRATSFFASWRQGIHQMPLPQRLIAQTRRSQGQDQGSGIRSQGSGKNPAHRPAIPCPRSRPHKATRSRMKTLSRKLSADSTQPSASAFRYSLFTCQRAKTAHIFVPANSCFSRPYRICHPRSRAPSRSRRILRMRLTRRATNALRALARWWR